MKENDIIRSPEVIAKEINLIKENTRVMLINASIEIGRRLTEAKEIVPHGEWSNWLEKNVDYKKSTANNLMAVFKKFGAEQLNLVGDNVKEAYKELTLSQAILLLPLQETEIEELQKENNISEMTTRELKKAIEAKKKAEERANEIEEDLKSTKALNQSMIDQNKQLTKEMAKLKEELNKSNLGEVAKLKEELRIQEEKIKEDEKKYREKIKELESKEYAVEVIDNLEDKKTIEEIKKKLELLEKEKEDAAKRHKEELEILKEEKQKLQDDAKKSDLEKSFSRELDRINEDFTKILVIISKMTKEDKEIYKKGAIKLLEIMKSQLIVKEEE